MSSTNLPRGAAAVSNDDDDPIVASYSVFVKPPLPENRNLVVLQYVNKTAQHPAQIRVPRIIELRRKPTTGMYEVDVPIDTSEAYDRKKGMAWGIALQKSMEAKKGGSLGLAGGFNIGTTANPGGRARRGGGAGAGNEDEEPLSWAEAARQDKVLRTQTFGGGRSAEEENTRHMIGVFQGKNLHLTPVSSVVHLRPVPHHLDAATEQERLSRAPAAAAAAAAAGPGATGEKTSSTVGRAIHMTIKSAMDDGGVATETMADRLRNVQTEPWQRMEWVHDEAELAWAAYNECLLLRSTTATTTATASSGDGETGKGKGKEKEKEPAAAEGGGTGDDDSGAPDLVERVSQLKTDWGERELLQAVSGVRPDAGVPGSERAVKTEERAEEARKQPGQPAKSAAAASAGPATGPRRGTRARAATTKNGAMEID
ncbi:hypothetical protein VTK56DRAFT_9120 [Thermocarpiscus australiensis]